MNFKTLLKYGLKGGVMAVVLNLIIFEIALRAFNVDFTVIIEGVSSQVMEIQVVLASFVPALLATVLYLVLVRKTKNPDKIFKIIALAILVLSFYNPFSAATNMSAKLILSFMHVVAAFEITKSLLYDFKRSQQSIIATDP